MQRIELDFIRGRTAVPWAGRALLAVALAFAGDLAYSYVTLQNALASNRAQVARSGGRAAQPATAVSREEFAGARDTVQRLSMPWTRLFGALEHAASDRVALLAIEPDPKTGSVLISGDSRDYLAVLTYVASLSREPGLSRVQLVRHEVRANDPQQPVAFAVSAAWTEGQRP